MAHKSRASLVNVEGGKLRVARDRRTDGKQNPNTIIMGKRRGRWVRDGAKALIGSTTPGLRFRIIHTGFIPFQSFARVAFKEFSPFEFDSTELRWIFDYLVQWVQRHEWHLQQGLAILDARDRRTFSHDGPPDDTPRDTGIHVESLRDGAIKRVH